MSESKIEQLRQKDSRDLSDEEVLELLKNDIESKGKVPALRDLRVDSPWSVTENVVERAAGSLNNALWLIGEEPNKEILDVDGDTELVEHELRGLEHELGRPPLSREGRQVYGKYDEDFRKEAGIPYQALSRKLMGSIDPEREDELVEMLFVEQKDPAVLQRNNETRNFRDVKDDERAAGYEISLVTEAYLPWVDETTETQQDESVYEIDSAKDNQQGEEFPGEFNHERTAEILELLAEGYETQEEIAEELGYAAAGSLQPYIKELKQYDLINTGGPLGTWPTKRGEEAYEQLIEEKPEG